ncbi:MAG: DUF362 domain-containing protein [Sedimentisphaerales bacterium]|nr:DUF362 domain-containing protein [Sedimentisphaerales bacterium]
MSKPVVALTRCDNYDPPKIADAIQRQFDLLGGLETFVRPGDTVLLKPNFIAPKSRRHATQTDPAFIIEMARLLKDYGAKPFVGDSPAWSTAIGCAKVLELDEPLKKLDVPLKDLDRPKWKRIGERKTRVGISSVALEADVIINIPKFKAHQQLGATFAIKNMFGCVTGKEKAIWHFFKGKHADDFCQLLIDIYKHLNPALTIIDAVTVMEGHGPINGRARPLGWLIGGIEPIACETVSAKLIGAQPEAFPILKTAQHIGFGCSDIGQIETVGDDFLEHLCTDFDIPNLVPIRFSFPHVCKSICKQIILLTKGTLKQSG